MFRGPVPYRENAIKYCLIYITYLFFYYLLTVLHRRPIQKRANFHEKEESVV